ncbi:MAG TPA: DNA polymerase domain-containing protein [Geobacteraceae bacterium]
MNDFCLEENRVLFGADRTERVVAAELAGRFIRLFFRDGGGVRFKDDPFHPFILLTDRALLDRFSRPVTCQELAGPGEFRVLARFDDWHGCLEAREFLSRSTGHTPSSPDAPYLYLSDPVHQHLLLTGKTLFKGLSFHELRRLAIDIETLSSEGYGFSNPEREEDRIVSIAIGDSDGFEEVISARELTEKAMLERLVAVIGERDPDVIEGHNLFRFDLEYLRVRARRHGVKLAWGRDGSEPRVHPSRFTVAERIVDYPRYDIYGRHVIDTYFLLLIYDVTSRELDSYGLKAAARHFGLASPDRVYLDMGEMNRIYRETPELLSRYNLDDVRETLALSRLLAYPYFLQCRMFPYSFQNVPVRGTATRINTLFLREYLRRGAAVPRGDGGGGFEGGYNEVRMTGVVGSVVHCDVASLYPSLILTYRLAPRGDYLGLFLPLLKELREFRLRAKKLARESSDPYLRDYHQALQQTFKVLINSFYGYLGTTIHNFSDPRVAAEVTRRGREIIGQMLAWLEAHNARPVEVDTDGIYFISPADATSPVREEELVNDLAATLPEGIDLELDGRYRAMFSYKMKNYALLDYDGRVTIKGSGLRSRGIEKYLREFLADMLRLLLSGAGEDVPPLHEEYLRRLRERRFRIEWIAKTETLKESPASYRDKVRKGKRAPAAAYELALQSGGGYRAGDQISYYVTGSGKNVTAYTQCRLTSDYDPARPDVNIDYYAGKLHQLYRKFAPYFSREPTLFD